MVQNPWRVFYPRLSTSAKLHLAGDGEPARLEVTWHPPGVAQRHTGMSYKLTIAAACVLVLASATDTTAAQQAAPEAHPDIRLFFTAIAEEDDQAEEALDQIAESWRHGYAGIIWDLVRFMEPPRRTRFQPLDFPDPDDPTRQRPSADLLAPEHPTTRIWRRLMEFLEDQTDQRFRGDLVRAHQWIWEQPYDPHPFYAAFKGVWYGQIDPRFQDFFSQGDRSTIRLDEIDWGGVPPNGIPPLRYPQHLASADADYLEDDHIVFGIAVNGETRAYPKRILAWHEMALDTLGGVELTIVYCTLCGTVIPYDSIADGQHIRLGTSGLLYRSNKLMFDEGTKSLWSTFEGVPVVGPLVDSGVRLRHRSVVTTTWGEWRRTHPETTVLSLETGHDRDYSEGAAYRDYFSTDRLMFDVSRRDDRLDNKDEVVVMLLEDDQGVRHPLAIAVEFLRDNRLYHVDHAGRHLVIVTTEDGANRVYDAADVLLVRLLADDRVADADGGVWTVTEDGLVAQVETSRQLPRVAAQRAFWFGWYAQFPETELIN